MRDECDSWARYLIRVAEIVEPGETTTDIEADRADNRVLEAAAEGGVDAIVSGDHHLHALQSWRGTVVQSPAAFLERFVGWSSQGSDLGAGPPRTDRALAQSQ